MIEWLALAALSSVGIEFEPVDCRAAGPAEYRTLSAEYNSEPMSAVLSVTLGEAALAGDCGDAASGLFRVEETPVLITRMPRSYDS